MKKSLFIAIPIAILSLGLCSYFVIEKRSAKHAYVINQQLFDGFKGKQQLESELKVIRHKHKLILDSLASMIRTSGDAPVVARYKQLEDEYSSQEERMSATYTADIWKQINQHLSTYGEEKGFDFIYGATGEGTLMYAREANNITEDVVLYINRKHEGN